MAPLKPALLIFLFGFTPFSYLQTADPSAVSILISINGLDFIRDLLVTKALSELTPLKIPRIQKNVNIPFVGNVYIDLSSIKIFNIDVPSSFIKPWDTGVAIIASGTACNLTMNWYYSYSTWLVPVKVSDSGGASVWVEGMEIGLTVGLENQEGSLKLPLMDCSCHVKRISIKLDGGASWLYQGIIDAFKGEIRSAVENAINNKLKEGISKLDSYMQSLPSRIAVDDVASLNVTFVNQPSLGNSSIVFAIDGLFTPSKRDQHRDYRYNNSQTLFYCSDSSKMLGISLKEAVFNSASELYFNEVVMQWIVDKVPDHSLLNTAGWRFVVPQLYKKYPNHDMNMNVSLTSPPVISILQNNIGGTIFADWIIEVLEAEQVIPVACISLVIRASGSVKVSGNNLSGSVKLDDLKMSLKWSNIGNLHMYLVQPVAWTIIETVGLPYANSHLAKGFPLPVIHGFTLQNADITCLDSQMSVCSNMVYVESLAKQTLVRT